jgi:hypothetical protein
MLSMDGVWLRHSYCRIGLTTRSIVVLRSWRRHKYSLFAYLYSVNSMVAIKPLAVCGDRTSHIEHDQMLYHNATPSMPLSDETTSD